MKIIDDIKLDFNDVLIRPRRSNLSSRSEVDTIREFSFPHASRKLSCSPIMAANMDTTGSFEMAKCLSEFQAITCLNKHYTANQLINFFENNQNILHLVFCSIGTSQKDIDKIKHVYDKLKENNKNIPNICIDIANGYSENFVNKAYTIRKMYPEIIIIAGNVVTPEMTEELILRGGVDIVKIGIGSGSVCTTRLKTGIGYPQLSAIMECGDAAHGLGGHICSDGGCVIPADICKAFGGNADFVMLGGMLAGTDCCDGEWEYEWKCKTLGEDENRNKEWWQSFDPKYPTDKRKVCLKFYGMSSQEAMSKHDGGVANYRTSEGRCVKIPYKGTTQNIMQDILGGIRSACTYIGAKSIKDFSKKTIFIRVNNTHNRIYEKYDK